MFENLKFLSDDEVISIINTIVTDNMDVELADLKLILAEASGRKLEKKYINIIAERIKVKIQPEQVEMRRNQDPVFVKPAPEYKEEPVKPVEEPMSPIAKNEEVSKPTFDDVYSSDPEEEEEYEKYPALSFVSGLFKVFAWIMLAGLVILSVISGILLFKQPYVICAVIFVGIVSGLIIFLTFYCAAESIRVKIDTEDHLNNIEKLLKNKQ